MEMDSETEAEKEVKTPQGRNIYKDIDRGIYRDRGGYGYRDRDSG